MKKIAALLFVTLLIASLCLPALAADTDREHNHKYYFDYISRSADGRTVESFGLFCEDCDEIVHVKPNAEVIDYHIDHNGWGTAGKTTWLFVDGLVTLYDPVRISGTVNLVLLDNALLRCEDGLNLYDNSTLNIYSEHLDYSPAGENNTMGTLRATVKREYSQDAAIGGFDEAKNVTVNIYGGDIYAYSAVNGAAIGSGTNGTATVNIYGGKVNAVSADCGAAIGGGYDQTDVTVNFHGGIVHARCTGWYAASIGCGFHECKATVNFFGGYVYGESQTKGISTLAGIVADTINVAEGTKKLGNTDGLYDAAGLALAKQAGFIDANGYPVGSVLSEGNVWVIVALAAVIVVSVLVLVFGKKKKKPAEKSDE